MCINASKQGLTWRMSPATAPSAPPPLLGSIFTWQVADSLSLERASCAKLSFNPVVPQISKDLSLWEPTDILFFCYMSFGMILADDSTMEPKDFWPMETAIFSNCWSLSVQRSQCQHWSTALLIKKWIHGQWSTVSLKYRQVTEAENIPLAMGSTDGMHWGSKVRLSRLPFTWLGQPAHYPQ